MELAAAQAATHDVAVAAGPELLSRLVSGVRPFELPFHLNRRDPRLLWAARQALAAFKPQILHAHANKAAAVCNVARFFLPPMARVATVQNTKRSTAVFRPFHRVIAVSRQAGAALGRDHTVIWNALPPPQSPPAPTGAPEPPSLDGPGPVFIAVGRFVPAKGFDLLIEAMREVNACLWLVGDGPMRADLEAAVERNGLRGRVWLAGFRNDVDYLLSRADAMVLSSRNEGFPFVLVEALHRRVPVISTRIGGADEVLPESRLCDCNDLPGLKRLLQNAAADLPALRADLEPVFARAERELALEHTGARIETVYQEAVQMASVR